jgi:hypothetical protein
MRGRFSDGVTRGTTRSATDGFSVAGGELAVRCLMVNADDNSKISAAEAVRSKVNFLLPSYEFLFHVSCTKLVNPFAATSSRRFLSYNASKSSSTISPNDINFLSVKVVIPLEVVYFEISTLYL